MIDTISKEMSSVIRTPKLVADTFYSDDVDESVHRFLRTRHKVQIGADKIGDLAKVSYVNGFNEHNVDYSDLDDPYGVSDYLADRGIYVPHPDYLRYIAAGGNDLIMNVYSGDIEYTANGIAVKRTPIDEDFKVFQFPSKRKITYTRFMDEAYVHGARISQYMYRFPMISVNLPYEYYSKQEIPEYVYNWDVDRQEFRFGSKNVESFVKKMMRIGSFGINRHIFMQVCNGKIVSTDEEGYLTLLIAMYLKLPTIPVTLYMLNNTSESNMLISHRPIDVANKVMGTTIASNEEIILLNKITNPKMLFEKHGVPGVYMESIGDEKYYIPNIDLGDKSSTEFPAVDYYYNPNADWDVDNDGQPDVSTDEALANLHKQMISAEQAKMSKEVTDFIEKIQE